MSETPEIPGELPLADQAVVIAAAAVPPATPPAETSQEPSPMIDIHPPQHGGITRRDFFVHLFTVVLGILIAIGLEQGVEYIHHRRELAEARKELATERKIDVVRFSIETEEIHRYVPVLQHNLAIFVYLRQHPGKPLPPSLGVLRWSMMSTGMLDSAWTTAQHNGVVDYMRPSESRNDAQLYTRLDMLTQQIRDARAASMECWRYRVVDSDPTHLSPDQLDHQIDLVSKALFTYRNLANTMRNAHLRFPDFAPAPSDEDFRAILYGAPMRSADDQQDYKAVDREIVTFTDYESSLDQNDGPE